MDSSNLSFKLFIFLLWGFSILLFTTKELTSGELYSSPVYKNGYLTLTEKFSSVAVSADEQIVFYAPPLGIISSYDVNLVVFEIYFVENNRGPPSQA